MSMPIFSTIKLKFLGQPPPAYVFVFVNSLLQKRPLAPGLTPESLLGATSSLTLGKSYCLKKISDFIYSPLFLNSFSHKSQETHILVDTILPQFCEPQRVHLVKAKYTKGFKKPRGINSQADLY